MDDEEGFQLNHKPDVVKKHTTKRNFLIFLGSFVIVIGFVLIILGGVEYGAKVTDAVKQRLGVVVDAGGSGTRLIVYACVDNSTFTQLKYIKCERRGLHTYSEAEFPQLRSIITNCLEKGVKGLPQDKDIPLYFGASAGMRMLQLKNSTAYARIWSLVRKSAGESKLKLLKADTITGFEEAKWSWMAVNYLKQMLGDDESYGMVELGSSSLQMAFPQDDNTPESDTVKTISVDGVDKKIYGKSYLCYGNYEIRRRFKGKLVKTNSFLATVDNPCDRTGYKGSFTSEYLWSVPCSSGEYAKNTLGEEITGPTNRMFNTTGAWNFEKCYTSIKQLLDRSCKKGTCGLNNVFQPKVEGNFVGLSTLYYMWKYFGLSLTTHKKDEFVATIKSRCNQTWDPTTKDKHEKDRCFQAVYAYYLINDGFKFDESSWDIEFVGKINGQKPGWSLGLIQSLKDDLYERFVYKVRRVASWWSVLLVIIGAFAIMGAVSFIHMVWARAQKKMRPPTNELIEEKI